MRNFDACLAASQEGWYFRDLPEVMEQTAIRDRQFKVVHRPDICGSYVVNPEIL